MKRALFIGRFQPFHTGHMSVLQELAELGFDEVIIGIGSTQYQRTPDNPLSFVERQAMITTVLESMHYPLRYHIVAIPDINDDDHWVNHVNTIVQAAVGDYEAVFTGNDWVCGLFEASHSQVKPVHKIIMIDGTTIRKMIAEGDERWREFVDPLIQQEVQNTILSIMRSMC